MNKIIIPFLVLIFIFIGCTRSDDEQAEKYIKESNILRSGKKYEEAIKTLKYIKMNYPRSKYWEQIDSEIREIEAESLYTESVEKYREKKITLTINILNKIVTQYKDTKYFKLAKRDLNFINEEIKKLWDNYYKTKEQKDYNKCIEILKELNHYVPDPKITEEYKEIQKKLQAE